MRRDCFAALWLLAPLLWLFRRALFLGEVFAFRDAAHYYFPFYQYVQHRWKAGLPLWNPLDSIGQPLLGDPTAAVMYPGKVVFLLPMPYELCFALYLVGHLWLAGFGAYKLSRGFRANWCGAIIAGLAYGLSGQVLFQYCNPIYCVGAAWLPWAILSLIRWLRRTGRWDGGLLCFTLSMMVLGGDPQTAYHVLLLGLLYAIVSYRDNGRRFAYLCKDVGLLCFVAVATLLLCAVQVFPAFEWSQQSDRALRTGPRSIYEWFGDGASAVVTGRKLPSPSHLWMRTGGESHAEMVYQFSVGPWRWLELAWPNVSGRPFPTHRRWLSAFAGEGRMWTPSLYLGLLPLILALRRFRLSGASTQTKWWSWTVVLAATAAVGGYGLCWIVDEFRYHLDPHNFAHTELLPGLGGVYWLMTVALPGYIEFRYPAKLCTIATLGLAVLAAKGFPAVFVRRRQLVQQNVGLIVVSLCLAAFALTPITSSWLAQAPSNRLFGPLDVATSRIEIAISFLHAVAVAAGMMVLLKWNGTRKRKWAFVGLVAVELTIAQASSVQTVPPVRLPSIPAIAKGATMYRCEPVRAYPQPWEQRSSELRFQELQQNDLATLMPKHHLTADVRSIQSAVPMTCSDYIVLAELARNSGRRHAGGHDIPNRQWINLLGAEHVFAPREDFSFSHQVANGLGHPSILHSINAEAFPRTWLVHKWEILDELVQRDRKSLLQRTQHVMLDGKDFRDFRKVAIIESSAEFPTCPPAGTVSGEICEIIEENPERILLRVKTNRPAVVVLADQYYPGWKATVSSGTAASTPTRLFRVNRVMRGIYVEAGDYQVEFRYRPFSVALGITTSILAWTVLVLAMVVRGRQRNLKSES